MTKTVSSITVGRFRGLTVALIILAGSLAANASIEYQLNTPFGTDPAPNTGNGPWIDASFIDVTPGEVLLTVINVNLLPGEFVQGNGNGASGGLYFNLNPGDNPADLKFTPVSSTGNFGPVISTGEDKFKADGDGYYDIQFDFSQQTFSVDSSFTYEITGISTLTAADFEYESAPGGGLGPFYAAAKIQGLPGGSSTYIEPSGGYEIIPVPEPGSLVLLAGGIGVLCARSTRVRRV